MTPAILASELTGAVSRVCKCEVSWMQHPGQCSQTELLEIRRQVAEILERAVKEAPWDRAKNSEKTFRPRT